MEHHFCGTCVNGTACLALYDDIQKDEALFVKKNKITINTFSIIWECLREIWKNGKTQTFSSEAAKIFKKYGFSVKSDENNINFIIE